MTLQQPRMGTKIRTHTATLDIRDTTAVAVLQVDITRYRRVFVTAYHTLAAGGVSVDVEINVAPLGARTTMEWDAVGSRWVETTEILRGGGFLNLLNSRFPYLNHLISGQSGYQLRIAARALTAPTSGSITVAIEGELA